MGLAWALLVAIGALHSVLGEVLLIRPLLAIAPWEGRRLPDLFARRTLRFAWHVTTILLWTLAGLLAARGRVDPARIVAAGMLTISALAWIGSRGAHFSWPVFGLIGGVLLVEARGVEVLAQARPGVGFVAASVLAVLAAVHVYWALGGRGGLGAVVPHDPQTDRPLFVPGPLPTAAVTVLLLAAGALLLASAGHVRLPLPAHVTRWLTLAVALAFALRALGDFRWVGFFKRVHGTRFAATDTALFTPLCVLLSAAAALVALAPA